MHMCGLYVKIYLFVNLPMTAVLTTVFDHGVRATSGRRYDRCAPTHSPTRMGVPTLWWLRHQPAAATTVVASQTQRQHHRRLVVHHCPSAASAPAIG